MTVTRRHQCPCRGPEMHQAQQAQDKPAAKERGEMLLRHWRPVADLDKLDISPPTKRARMVATQMLYDSLRTQVFSALRQRKQRDQQQRATSRDIAERNPLTFEATGLRSPSPTGRNTSSSKATPMLKSNTIDKVAALLPSMILESWDTDELACIESVKTSPTKLLSLGILRKVGSQENLAEMAIPAIPIF